MEVKEGIYLETLSSNPPSNHAVNQVNQPTNPNGSSIGKVQMKAMQVKSKSKSECKSRPAQKEKTKGRVSGSPYSISIRYSNNAGPGPHPDPDDTSLFIFFVSCTVMTGFETPFVLLLPPSLGQP